MPKTLEEMGQELEEVKTRLQALEDAAGFEQPPKEDVKYKGGDPSQGRE